MTIDIEVVLKRIDKGPFCLSDITQIIEDARTLAAAYRAEKAITDKLPKTADGVPITPGMKLWGSLGWNDEPATATLRGCFRQGYSVSTPEWGMNVQPEKDCYSTREAALDAKGGADAN